MRPLAASALLALAITSAAAHEGGDHAEPSASSTDDATSLVRPFTPSKIQAPFLEQFTDDWSERWTASEATKKTPVGGETFAYVGKWEVEEPSSNSAFTGDKGLVAKTKAAHHGISAPFTRPVDFSVKPLVIQYEVKYQKGGNCGGGYLKLLEDGFQTSGKEFSDKTPWVVMFGPDLTCPGTKVHFIFRHKNPITGEYEEKHLKSAPMPSINQNTMLYTLVVNPDQSFQVLVDDKEVSSGSLLENFDPPVNPPAEIDDSEDKKPADWVDEAKISDPDAKKPDDWDEDAPYSIPDEDAIKPDDWLEDEPEFVPDPEAEKPEEWDDEEDGDWIPPTVKNPKCEAAPGCGPWKRPTKPNPDYKGKWYAPLVDNPAYKGVWAPRKIPNPGFFEDKAPVQSLHKIGGVGIELWTMTEDILFSNIYVGHSAADAKALAQETFHVKTKVEKAAEAKAKKAFEEDGDVTQPTLTGAPIAFIRKAILEFVELAKIDPVLAVKSKPETAGAVAIAIFTLFGMLGALFGIVGAAQKPVTKSTKKTDAPSADSKPATEDKTPVGSAGKSTPAKDGIATTTATTEKTTKKRK